MDSDDHLARVTGLQRAVIEFVGLPFGEVWVTEVDGVIQSVALSVGKPINTAQSTFDPLFEIQRQLEGSRHDISIAAGRTLEVYLPKEAHIYLGAIGTSTSMQGKGLGTMTLSPILATADSKRLPMYLETSSESNVAFYQRRGFQVEEHLSMPDGGPDVWTMRRNPSRIS